MNHGRIIATGNHATLLQTSDLYRSLHSHMPDEG